ncbi:MAG TPA: hypothetical protein VI299_17660 [Polyangiales bacterium]
MGKQTTFWLLWAVLGGCASAPSLPIQTVARDDLRCTQVSVTEVADNRYQAVGCGSAATYAKLCSGRNCSWVRVRSASEAVAQQQTAGGATYGQRQIIPAPPPAPREIIQAPPPAPPPQREVIPAPPPETQAAPAAQPDPNAPAQQSASAQGQAGYTPEPTPLTQGDLSQPYQVEVPIEPVTQRVQYPPPAPLVEPQPPPPAPSYVWVNGYWWWGGPSWTWVPGYWCAPRFGYSYVASSWYWSGGYWWFGPGGWARPGSTLIVAQVGPRPSRYVTSRSFTPHYVATGPAGRIGTGPAHAPQRFTPQQSPLYHYPTSSSQRVGRMGAISGPGGHSGSLSSGPARFGTGSPGSPGVRYGGSSSMSRMGGSPASPSSSSYRAPSMSRMPSSTNSSVRSGGSFGRMGGGGGSSFRSGGGGSFGRMGGGGGAPHSSAGGRH